MSPSSIVFLSTQDPGFACKLLGVVGPISGSPVGRVLSFVKKFLDFLCWKIVYEVTITCFFFYSLFFFLRFPPGVKILSLFSVTCLRSQVLEIMSKKA